MNVTARIARWSADHWRTVTFGWLAIVVALGVVATQVGTVAMSSIDEMTGDSKVGQQLLLDAGLAADGSEVVLVTSADGAANSPRADALAQRIADRVSSFDGVDNVVWDAPGFVTADGTARMVTFDLDETDGADITELVKPIRAAVTQLNERRDGFRVQQFGDATIGSDIGTLVGEDLTMSELITAPITLVILFGTFGALVAAGLPLLIGAVSVFAALSLGTILSHLLPQSEFAPNLVTMLGIALGVDYTLFILRREREERAAGHGRREALLRAAATSGTAVVISGVTVIVALSGLLASGAGMFVSMGIATMLVVAMVLLAALFVVPALLGRLGDGIERGRVPHLRRLSHRSEPRPARQARTGRAWGGLVRFAVRRPVATTLVVGTLLVTAAAPALDMRTGEATLASFPSRPSIDAALEFDRHFPGGSEPGEVVLHDDRGDLADGRRDAAVEDLRGRALDTGLSAGPIQVRTSDDGRTTQVTIPFANAETRATSDRSIERLRTLVADTVGDLPATTVAVAGSPAESWDFAHGLSDRLPLVFAVVLGAAFVLLTCAFRSLVVPTVAILLNLLSVAVAYGFLVWGFQEAHLDGIIDVAGEGTVVPWMPMFLFALLFGLSMDYHVFLLSRIREAVDHGYSTRDAVVRGVRTSASTITSAAFIMVGVFAAFALSRLAEMQQMGAGLAVAILVDATIIRALLLPAVMSLLGEANWYLPRWLHWLPTVSTEGRETGTPSSSHVALEAEAPPRELEAIQ